MVEVAYRAQRYLHGPDPECIRDTKEAAEMLLESLERLVSPPLFIRITSEVQQQLDKNKATKKMKEKTEFVNNPKLYAMRKVNILYFIYVHLTIVLLCIVQIHTYIYGQIAKSKKKKESKKRKNERHATMRGMKRHRL